MRDKNETKSLTRRGFLSTAAAAALAQAAGISPACARSQPVSDKGRAKTPSKREMQKGAKPGTPVDSSPNKRSTVVLVRDQRVLGDGRSVDPAILGRMLDDAVAELMQKPADLAWKALFSADDVVGIKSNAWRFLPTPKEIENHIQNRLAKIGIKKERMAVEDREVRDNPIFKNATALLNVRPMRTHHWSGVGSCIKNYIVFADDLPKWHPDSCADLGGLWDLPAIKGKTRLNILVMLTPLFHSKGPHDFQAEYTWPYRGLIVGTDPVAVDATGVRILEVKRKEYFGKQEPFAVSPKHIQVAEQKYKLGVFNANRIDVRKIGWMDGILI
jgi:hypothetical protein